MKLLLVVSIIAGAALAQSRSADEAAVRDVVRRYVDARDRKDAAAIGALFTTDADQLVSSGTWRKGRDEIVRGTIAASKNETGKRTITVESVRFVAPNIAIADGPYEIGERRMWTTFLIMHDAHGWRIAAIRNMLPAK